MKPEVEALFEARDNIRKYVEDFFDQELDNIYKEHGDYNGCTKDDFIQFFWESM